MARRVRRRQVSPQNTHFEEDFADRERVARTNFEDSSHRRDDEQANGLYWQERERG